MATFPPPAPLRKPIMQKHSFLGMFCTLTKSPTLKLLPGTSSSFIFISSPGPQLIMVYYMHPGGHVLNSSYGSTRNILFSNCRRGSMTIRPHPWHLIFISAPMRIICQVALPQGCCFFMRTMSPRLNCLRSTLSSPPDGQSDTGSLNYMRIR